jgi:methyl-accepting chemotaxis protein
MHKSRVFPDSLHVCTIYVTSFRITSQTRWILWVLIAPWKLPLIPQIAEQAGSLLGTIIPDITKIADLVQEITAASNEQRTGAEQVNNAVQQLDQVIKQNTYVSEEVASSSEELSAQAVALQEAVSFFKLDSDEHKAASNLKKAPQRALPRSSSYSRPRRKQNSRTEEKSTGIHLDFGDGGDGADDLDNEFERF